VTCREGPCPEGLACVDNVCVVPVDAAADGNDANDAMDGPAPSLTCADPGTIALGDTVSGNTSDAMNLVSAMCGGFVTNGRDDVYKLDVPVATQITLKVVMGTRKAFVIGPCVQFPSSCLGNARAVMGAPISVTTAVRPSFIVVDEDAGTDTGDTYQIQVQ